MERKFVKKDEDIKLIMECRQSGYTFPNSQSKSVGTAVVQEVVKRDVVEHEMSSPIIEQNARPLPISSNTDVAAELMVGNGNTSSF